MRPFQVQVVALAVGTLVGCNAATETEPDPVDETRAEIASEDPAARSPDWPSAGHDWSHTGHNPAETTLTPATVGGLRVVWTHVSPGPTPGVTVPVIGTPVVVGDTVYLADAAGMVFARALADGALRWGVSVSQASPEPVFGSRIQSAPVVTRRAVFVGDNAAVVHKLDRATGTLLWSTDLDSNPGAIIQGDPTVFGDLVIVGVAGFENVIDAPLDATLRGSVAALDAGDGDVVWQTFTTSDQSTPAPRFGGGVGVWSSPAIDPERQRVFIGTGQYYEPGAAAPDAASAADVDYSDSLLSLSLERGHVRAHRQFTAGDVWGSRYPDGHDFDVGIPPTLFTVHRRGCAPVPAVGVGDKEGTYYVMDRRTLAPLWSVHVADGSVIGGFQATAAYADGVIYVAAHEAIDGASLGTHIPPGQSATYLSTPEGTLLMQRASLTHLEALDAATGAVIWQVSLPGAITFAPLVLGGGVLYQADINGAVRAFDAATGELLAQRQIGGVPDGTGGVYYGDIITAMSLSRGRLLVSSSGLVPGAPGGVTVFGL